VVSNSSPTLFTCLASRFGEFKYSSAFSPCNILVASEIAEVHSFLQSSLDLSNDDQKTEWQIDAQQLDKRLTDWMERVCCHRLLFDKCRICTRKPC